MHCCKQSNSLLERPPDLFCFCVFLECRKKLRYVGRSTVECDNCALKGYKFHLAVGDFSVEYDILVFVEQGAV